MAFGDVVSSDVVGYAGAALRGGNQAAGVGGAFVNVDGSDLTLGDLTVVGYNTTDGYADFEIQAKQLDGYGRGGITYYWIDVTVDNETYKGWYNDDASEDLGDLALLPGEGLWVYSPSTSYSVQSAGAVSKTPIAVTLRGGNQAKMVSNPMPATLTLGDITITGYNSKDGYADFEIQAKKLDGYGRGGTTYYWIDAKVDEETYYGWYNDDASVDYSDVEVAAGEGLWIYSPSTAYSVVFPSPLAE